MKQYLSRILCTLGRLAGLVLDTTDAGVPRADNTGDETPNALPDDVSNDFTARNDCPNLEVPEKVSNRASDVDLMVLSLKFPRLREIVLLEDDDFDPLCVELLPNGRNPSNA